MPERRVFARRLIRYGIGPLWLLPAAFFGYFALDGGTPGGQRAIYAALAVAFLVLAVRTMRVGVITGPNGVTVRGVLSTRRLRWDEIERFEWGRWRGFGDYPVGVVRRRDGSAVTVLALNPPFEFVKGTDRRVPRLLEELNELLGRARGIPAPDSGAPPDPRG
jgi:Bacterial PH domain